MDEEVYGFSDDNVSPVNEIEHSSSAPAMNGGKAKRTALTQQKMKAKARDMADRGIDEEVYGFASGLVSGINGQERSDDSFIPNGSQSDWNWLSQRRHHKKHHKRPDVAERNMDEEVHGFVSDSLPPLTEWEHTRQPFIPNGSDASAFDGAAFNQKKHHHKHHKKDIAERGMDEEVHGFVWEALPPLNTRVRSDDAFIPNGSDEKAWDGAAFHQKKHHNKHHQKHHRKDIGERGYDEEVQQFVKEYTPPLNT
jgi:hypothetical protein